ncbi:hypothetical protein [Phocaeicola sp.]
MGILKFCLSKHRSFYCSLAFKHRTTPWRVYKLAHGSEAHSVKEISILKELKEVGIIKDFYSRIPEG